MGETSTLSVHVERRFASAFEIATALDTELPAGSLLVLFGPSGAGKTAILRHIAGLERPDAGRIRFGGEVWCDVTRRRWLPPQSRRVGVVFQEPTLFPHLSVRENIEYGVPPETRAGRAAELAQLLGIADLQTRLPRAISGGEAQRVALARALAPGPRLLLLDEPFASLDAPTRMRLRRELRVLLQRTKVPAILITHDRTEALALGDSMAVVIRGRVRQVGTIGDVFSRPGDAEIAAALGIEAVLPARVVSSSAGLLTLAVAGVALHAAERTDQDAAATGSDVYACIRAEDVTLEMQSPAHASARNHLSATVVAITPEGPVDRVALDCGFPLDALITHRSHEELGLRSGATLTAAIKATSIHVVPKI